MARVYERLGSQVLPRELEDIGLENTPQCDPYEDETQNEQIFPQLAEELEPMQEVLPVGDNMAIDHVVAHSHDANGNVMGRAHTNPIFNTRMY